VGKGKKEGGRRFLAMGSIQKKNSKGVMSKPVKYPELGERKKKGYEIYFVINERKKKEREGGEREAHPHQIWWTNRGTTIIWGMVYYLIMSMGKMGKKRKKGGVRIIILHNQSEREKKGKGREDLSD